MTRDAHEIEREGMLSDMDTLRAVRRELHAEVERLRIMIEQATTALNSSSAEVARLNAKIAYVRQRSQRACEILNEFDATEPKP